MEAGMQAFYQGFCITQDFTLDNIYSLEHPFPKVCPSTIYK